VIGSRSSAAGAEGGGAAAQTTRGDTGDVALVSFVYTTALAIESITMPLLALHLGYNKPTIGVLTALSAVAQIFARIGSARLLRRRPDREVIVVACLLMAGSAGMLALSAALPMFVAAEFIQGAGRGAFWTGSQAHVVRSRSRAVGRLATTTFISSFGQLLGPLIAGPLVQISAPLALIVSASVGIAAALIARLRVRRLEPVPIETKTATLALWRSPPVRLGCWAGLTAGGWRAMLNSYVPVLLAESGLTTTVIGVVIAAGNGTSIAGSGMSGFVGDGHRRVLAAVGAATLCTGVGVLLLGPGGQNPVVVGILLGVSGWGAGALQTLSPAVAATAVERSLRPDAVALAGAFRAGALLLAPLTVAALLSGIGLTAALEVTGTAMALPAIGALRQLRAPTRKPPEAADP
jgi:MFS family permease